MSFNGIVYGSILSNDSHFFPDVNSILVHNLIILYCLKFALHKSIYFKVKYCLAILLVITRLISFALFVVGNLNWFCRWCYRCVLIDVKTSFLKFLCFPVQFITVLGVIRHPFVFLTYWLNLDPRFRYDIMSTGRLRTTSFADNHAKPQHTVVGDLKVTRKYYT